VTERHHPVPWHRSLAIAAAVLCAVLVALIAVIVVIAPKVINSSEVRSRIEATIAKELHGTVTYDRVELALLPRPNVILHRLTVQVPGTLSALIDAVRVHARLFPLFRGQFAVSSIDLIRPDLTIMLSDDEGSRSRKQSAARPAGGSFDTAMAIAGRELPDLSIKITKGKIGLLRDGSPFLSLGNLDASFTFLSDGQEGQADGATAAAYHITGMARATASGTAVLSAPIKISVDRFDATPGILSVIRSRVRLQDLDASISGELRGYLTGSPRSDLKARGTIGPDTLAWMQDLAGLPDEIRLRAPLTITGARLRSTGTGSAASRTFTVSAKNEGGTTIDLALRQEPGLFSIDDLHVKDSDSDAVAKISSEPAGYVFSFTGNLTNATIERVLEGGRYSSAWLKGDLQGQMPRGQWDGATVQGFLEGGQFPIPASLDIPVAVDRFSVFGDGTTIYLKPAVLSLGAEVFQMEGSGSFSQGGIDLDVNVTTDRASVSTLRALIEQNRPKIRSSQEASTNSKPAVSGSVRLLATAFVLDRYQADKLDLRMTFGKEQTSTVLEHALFCGITFTGTLRTMGSEVEASLKPQATGKKLEESLPCIFHEDMGLSGTYDLSAQLAGRGTWDTLIPSTRGSFALKASQGRFQSDHVVKGIIAYLNSTSLLKGSHDKLLMEGVPYETIAFRGTLRDGTISLSEGVIKGRDLHIAADGEINLRKGTLSLNVLAAPFTKLDRLLGSVPLVKYLVGNALIVVPARVEGTFDRPNVKPLPVASVGKNVTNLMKNVVQAPMKIIEPDAPQDLERKNKAPQE
jgi:hypothetical protein